MGAPLPSRLHLFREAKGLRSPLVLIHGFSGLPVSWARTVVKLTTPRTIIGVLLPGHGNAVDVDDSVHSFGEAVAGVAALLRANGLAPVHVAGYSLGARIALGLVLDYPELVNRATLISAHFGLATQGERDERRAGDQRWVKLLREHGITAFVDAWQAQPLFATQQSLPEELLAEQRALRLAQRPEGLACALETLGLAQMPYFHARLGESQVPVTLVAGALDEKFRRLAQKAVVTLTRGQMRVISGCGHNPLLEAPGALAAILEEGKERD